MSEEETNSGSNTSGEPTGELSQDPRVGTVIGDKYRIVECLGVGGMGSVYRADHIEIGRTVAIKLLHSHLLENEEYVLRFQREARVASKLMHPNAVTAFDFGIDGTAPFLVMPFVEGRLLKSILLEQGALPLPKIAAILSQIGGALDDAHDLGIVHRDLKPDNIMILDRPGKTDWAWVLDFGIAKPQDSLAGDGPDSSLTRTGMFIGTPQYMAPEQALGHQVDLRTDVYALGIVLFQMLTGDLPFKSSSPVELLMKHVSADHVPARSFRPELNIPEAVSNVVEKALEKDPNNRYQSVRSLVEAFNAAVAAPVAQPIATKPKGTQLGKILQKASNSSAVASPSQKQPLIPVSVVLAGAGIAIAAVAAYALLLRDGANEVADSAAPSEQTTAVADATNVTPDVQPEAEEPLELAADSSSPASQSESASDRSSPREQAEAQLAALAAESPASESNVATGDVASGDIATEESATVTDGADSAEAQARLDAERDLLAELNTEESAAVEFNGGEFNGGGSAPRDEANSALAQNDANLDSSSARASMRSEAAEEFEPATATTSAAVDAPTQVEEPAPVEQTAPKLNPAEARKEAARLYAEGQKLLDAKEYSAALPVLEQAVQLRESYLAARLSLANCHLRLGQYEAARSQLDLALADDKAYAPTYYNFAVYYAVVGDSENAIASIREAVKRYPRAKKWAKEEADFATLRENSDFLAAIK